MTGWELVQSAYPPVVHARRIARRGAQHLPLCGVERDVRPVASDPFTSLFAQVTCRRCRNALDHERDAQ